MLESTKKRPISILIPIEDWQKYKKSGLMLAEIFKLGLEHLPNQKDNDKWGYVEFRFTPVKQSAIIRFIHISWTDDTIKPVVYPQHHRRKSGGFTSVSAGHIPMNIPKYDIVMLLFSIPLVGILDYLIFGKWLKCEKCGYKSKIWYSYMLPTFIEVTLFFMGYLIGKSWTYFPLSVYW